MVIFAKKKFASPECRKKKVCFVGNLLCLSICYSAVASVCCQHLKILFEFEKKISIKKEIRIKPKFLVDLCSLLNDNRFVNFNCNFIQNGEQFCFQIGINKVFLTFFICDRHVTILYITMFQLNRNPRATDSKHAKTHNYDLLSPRI